MASNDQIMATAHIYSDHEYANTVYVSRKYFGKSKSFRCRLSQLNLQRKLKISMHAETHTIVSTAKAFNISRRMVQHLKDRKQAILDEIEERDSGRVVQRKTMYDVVEATLAWCHKMRDLKKELTNSKIRSTARGFANEYNVPISFYGTESWVNDFTKEHSINVSPDAHRTIPRYDHEICLKQSSKVLNKKRTASKQSRAVPQKVLKPNKRRTQNVPSANKAKQSAAPLIPKIEAAPSIMSTKSDFSFTTLMASDPLLSAEATLSTDDDEISSFKSSRTRACSVVESDLVTDCSLIYFLNDDSDRLFREIPEDMDMNRHLALGPTTRRKGEEILNDVDQNVGTLIIEGKTKQVFDLPSNPGHCLVLSKDRITAGDGVKAHDLAGKAAISNKTNAKVFEILNSVGLRTAFVQTSSPTSFIARKCQMIPIEWVTRRLATGSFLKRNPGVPEGHRFVPVKLETFFKDDANHDPQWSKEQILSAGYNLNGTLIGPHEVDIIERTTILVFEILEKAWATKNCALIDMKVEFGVDDNGDILLSDIIDSDSWRLWPSGDKRLMVDKQVYRNLGLSVTEADLDQVRRNFEWVAEQLDTLLPATASDHLVAILMGSPADKEHCEKIRGHCQAYGLNVQVRVTSAHKGTEDTLKLVKEYEAMPIKVVLVAVAGRSNGLGPVLSGNSALPVINSPPVTCDNMERNIWSSLAVPSGLGCSTVLYAETAAIHAATMLGLSNYMVWARIRAKQLNMVVGLKMADKKITSK